jgi:hypothetical protein
MASDFCSPTSPPRVFFRLLAHFPSPPRAPPPRSPSFSGRCGQGEKAGETDAPRPPRLTDGEELAARDREYIAASLLSSTRTLGRTSGAARADSRPRCLSHPPMCKDCIYSNHRICNYAIRQNPISLHVYNTRSKEQQRKGV